MPTAAARSYSYLHPRFDELLAEAGGDQSKVIDLYARVSQANDERYRSTGGQVDDLVEITLEKGLIPGWVHVDDSLSAWKADVKRQAWDNLIARITTGETNGLAVWNLTRYSRQPRDGEVMIELAEKRKIIVLDSEGGVDLSTPKGQYDFRDQLNKAAYYSHQLSVNVKRGKRKKVREGEWNCSVRPFGFNLDMTVRADEAAILVDLAQRTIAGETQASLVEDLNARGILTSRGNRWDKNGLKMVLQRELNAGLIVHRGTGVSRKMDGDPILGEDTYRRVVAVFAARRRGRPASHLATGFLFCTCGHKMYGTTQPTRNGERRQVYQCNKSLKGCGASVTGAPVEKAIRELVIAALSDKRHIASITANDRALGQQLVALQSQLESDQRTLDSLDAKLKARGITYERWEALSDELVAGMTPLRTQIQKLSSPSLAPVDAEASRREWAALWDGTQDLATRRHYIERAFNGARLVVARGAVGKPFDPGRLALVPPERAERS